MGNSLLTRRVVQLEAKAPPVAGGCRCLGTLALYDEDEPMGPGGRRRVFCSQCGLTKATAHVVIGKQVYAMLGVDSR
jgi:hypothetical protein